MLRDCVVEKILHMYIYTKMINIDIMIIYVLYEHICTLV